MRLLKTLLLLSVFSACAAPGTLSPTSLPTPTPTGIPATPTLAATLAPPVTATPVPFFTVYGDKPIVPKGQPGTWDDRYTDPGAVVYYGGEFHMFRNGFRSFPGESQVGYVTSPDGYLWTKQGDEPVFRTKDVSYAQVAMYASSALVEDDGTWVIYFYTWDPNPFPSGGVIGRATANSPTGPWAADAEPVLQPGPDGAWDQNQVSAPHILKTTGGYIMYYSGADASGVPQIGMATSSDGIHWTKYNDEATTEASFVESDPVFQLGETGAWDSGTVHQPRVFQTADGWVMIYRGVERGSSGPTMKLGIATSSDGISWERSARNPVFEPSEVSGARQFYFANAVLLENTFFVFVEVGFGRITEIYLITHEGAIVP